MKLNSSGLTVLIVAIIGAVLGFNGLASSQPSQNTSDSSLPAATEETMESTQRSQFVFETSLMSASEIWLSGLYGEAQALEDSVPAVYVRWVQDRSQWIPRWSLELIADTGLLPGDLVDRQENSRDVIVLADPLTPGRNQQYSAKLSYNPRTGDLSLLYRNDTTDAVLVEGQLRLEGSPRLIPQDEQWVNLAHPHIQKYEWEKAYERMGSPLVLTRELAWEWVRVKENEVASQGGYQFWDVETPGLRLHWPQSEVIGEVRFALMAEEEIIGIYGAHWSAAPTVIPLTKVDLHQGDYTVRVTYVDGQYEQFIGEDRLRISPTKMNVTYEMSNRDNEDNVRVFVTLQTEADAGTIPFTLHTRFIDDNGDVLQVQTEKREHRIEFGRPSVMEYALTVPPAPGTIEIWGETTPGIFLEQMKARFLVPPAPMLRIWPVHDELPVEIGQPAVLRAGDEKPQLAVRTLRNGVIRGKVFQDGVEVAQIPARKIEEEKVEMIPLSESLGERGVFEVRVQLEASESQPAAYHSFFFSMLDEHETAERADGMEAKDAVSQIVFVGDDGKLRYIPDYRGNRIPDFSFAGYMGGGTALPSVPVQIVVEPDEGDATERIQSAIDFVSNLPLNDDGHRGAVLLRAGRYEVKRPLRISASGVVLRGEGPSDEGTVLVATGREAYNVIEVQGPRAYRPVSGSTRSIRDMYVPVGAHSFHVDDAEGFQIGDTIVVRRFGNAAWIQAIGMDQIDPRPGDPESTQQWQPFALAFERIITAIEGNQITIDAPVIQSIDAQWGGGEVFRVVDERISQVGVENLKAISEFDPEIECSLSNGVVYPCDEDHAHYFVRFNHVKDAWLRDVKTVHFAHGPVELASGSKRVTVQDAAGYEPISTITGSRRYPYASNGQLNLIQRVYSQGARHAFSVGARVTGPNVFLHSTSEDDHATSEPHHRWSVGGLYDNVSGPIQIQDRQWYGTGQGWSGAYYVTWNTKGLLVVQKPPTAQNWAIGHVGIKQYGDFGPREDGYWESIGQHVNPTSLYLQQLQDRLGPEAISQIGP